MRTAISEIVQAAHDNGWTEAVSPYARRGMDVTRFTRGNHIIDVWWTHQGRVSSADTWLTDGKRLNFIAQAGSTGKRAIVLAWIQLQEG